MTAQRWVKNSKGEYVTETIGKQAKMKYPEYRMTQQERGDMHSAATAETTEEDIGIVADNTEAFATAYPEMFWVVAPDNRPWEGTHDTDEHSFRINEDLVNWLYQEDVMWTKQPDMPALAKKYNDLCRTRGGEGFKI